jgi:CubicO group peptidase (beta-lactamase class C family)
VPGHFGYSDTDSETLAAVVSVVSGRAVDEFIQRRLLEPLGMKDTFCVLGKDAPPRSRVSSNHAGSPGLWHKYWEGP